MHLLPVLGAGAAALAIGGIAYGVATAPPDRSDAELFDRLNNVNDDRIDLDDMFRDTSGDGVLQPAERRHAAENARHVRRAVTELNDGRPLYPRDVARLEHDIRWKSGIPQVP